MTIIETIILIVVVFLIIKYWRKVKDATALGFMLGLATTFAITLYLHQVVSTWRMLKKKD